MARPSDTGRRWRRWWKPEDDLIRTRPLAEAAKLTGRTMKAVIARRVVLKKRGLAVHDLRYTLGRSTVGRTAWTDEADDLVKLYRVRIVAMVLGVGLTAVVKRRKELGVTR